MSSIIVVVCMDVCPSMDSHHWNLTLPCLYIPLQDANRQRLLNAVHKQLGVLYDKWKNYYNFFCENPSVTGQQGLDQCDASNAESWTPKLLRAWDHISGKPKINLVLSFSTIHIVVYLFHAFVVQEPTLPRRSLIHWGASTAR